MELRLHFVRLLVPFRDRLLEQGGRLFVPTLGLQDIPEVLQDDRAVRNELQRPEELPFGPPVIAAPEVDPGEAVEEVPVVGAYLQRPQNELLRLGKTHVPVREGVAEVIEGGGVLRV